jgi:hypothetical protein
MICRMGTVRCVFVPGPHTGPPIWKIQFERPSSPRSGRANLEILSLVSLAPTGTKREGKSLPLEGPVPMGNVWYQDGTFPIVIQMGRVRYLATLIPTARWEG